MNILITSEVVRLHCWYKISYKLKPQKFCFVHIVNMFTKTTILLLPLMERQIIVQESEKKLLWAYHKILALVKHMHE